MNIKRIEEIQKNTSYPNSHSVQQALLTVWNETAQEYSGTIDIYKKAIKSIENLIIPEAADFSVEIQDIIEKLLKELINYKHEIENKYLLL